MQTKEMMKVFTIGFNLEKGIIEDEVIEFEKDDNSNLGDYYSIIGCRSIDIVNLNKDIAVIVDDEGLLKSSNPVLQINTDDSNELQLSGKLIFAKNHYTDDGISLTGLSSGECLELMISLKIKVIGVTK